MKIQATTLAAALLLACGLLGPGAGSAQDGRQAHKDKIAKVKKDTATARAELAGVKRMLQGKALPAQAQARQAAFEAEFERRAAAFEQAAAQWEADPSDNKLRALDAAIDDQAASPGKPPRAGWGAPKNNKRMPAETKSAWRMHLTRDRGVQLAQAGGLTTIGGIRFSTPPEAGQAPADADLAEGGEVLLTPAVRAKAQELGKNPVAIANWVRQNVQFSPTWGALQTSDAVLRSLRGNAVDTATLTIALLRASGIPARYQFGTIDVPAAHAMNWLGGLSQPEAALDLLLQGGIAARGLSEAGQIRTIRMEHAWASAYVFWSPSRGARDGGAGLQPPQHPSPNAPLNAWMPVDGAYKQHTIVAGANLAEVAPFNAAAALDSARQGAVCTAASATGVRQAPLLAHYGQFRAQAQQQLDTLGADARVAQVLGSTSITPQPQTLLAGTLAHPQVVAQAPSPALPEGLRWQVELALADGAQGVLRLQRPLSELQGRSLHLGFVPESEADAQTLAALLRPQAGGDPETGLPARIAAYLVRVKAQLRLDGQVVGEGGSFTLGQPLTLSTLLQNPEGNATASESTVTAGEAHAWSVQGPMHSAAAVAAVSERLNALRAALGAATLPAGATQSAELLQAMAVAYQASLDAKARWYQRVGGAVEARLPGLVRASSRWEAEQAFGLVVNVRPGGVGLHADRFGSAVAPRGAALAAAAAYARQTLERASAEAHRFLERTFGSARMAQSAVASLAYAAQQGQTIWRADTQTLAQVLNALEPASTVRGQLEHAVSSGMQGLVAPAAVSVHGLAMDPLILQDPQAGVAAYAVNARFPHVVQLTAQQPGPAGWLGSADAQASKAIVLPAIDGALAQLNTAQALLGDVESVRWNAFGGRTDVLDGLYQARIAEASSTSNACDWLVATLATQLGSGLPGSAGVNRAPVITSEPVANAGAEAAYSYNVVATDPDGDTLTFSLVAPPTGMVIGTQGQISWPRATVGDFLITVRVSDGQAIAEQRYALQVGTAAALSVQASLSPTIATAGQTVTLTVVTQPAGAGVTRSATLNGAPLTLSAQGIAVFQAPAAGAHPIVVTASNGTSSATREIVLTVRDGGDTQAPGAAITSPEADAGLRGLVAVRGTATDARFAYYRLLLRRVGEPDTAWQEFARGLSQVPDGELGKLDTTRHENGLYQIALQVVDVNGAEATASVTVELIGSLKLGQFRLSFADIRADANGLPLMLTRTYDSTKKDVFGDFGWGWSASGSDISVRKNMTFGLGWEIKAQNVVQLCLRPVGKRRITVSLPDGGLYRFDAKNAQECSTGQAPEVNVVFDAIPGPTGGASGRTGAGAQLTVVDGALVRAQGGMLQDEEGNPWNPKDFLLTTEEGFKYLLREGVGIQSVTDPYGNKVTYGANGYQHTANLGLTFVRDPQGRITRATDPAGKSLVYAYNAQGELESVTDRDGKVTRFAYATIAGSHGGGSSGNTDLRHLLASVTDPRGQVVMSNQFDQLGRLTGTADANGQAARQEFDLAAQTQTVTDRRGNRTVYTFDNDGNITQSVNALGQTITFAFDASGNETTVTNVATGEVTSRTFDSVTGKQLSETNPLGHTTRTAYEVVGAAWQRTNPLSTTDARNHTTHYTYEDLRQPGAVPKAIQEPLGRTTTIGLWPTGNLGDLVIAGEALHYDYDGKGRRTREVNGLGHVTEYDYDANGNETVRKVHKSVSGQTVTFVTSRKYDGENRVVEETDPLGGKRTTAYNAAGKVERQTDSLGRATVYAYDANARLTRTTYPDGTFDATEYDAEGNEVAKTDRAGRTTRMRYDALNRLDQTTYPDGTTETTEFDAAGRVTKTTDRRGKATTMEYDGAGRQTATVDPEGVRVEQTFDPNGNRETVKVDGRTTRYEYDALNRLTKTTWPDGATHTSTYRPDNRKESDTDPRGVVTSYGYDAAGRLTSVTQSLTATPTATTATTQYRYDETGAKTTQIDALGRTTTWTLDGNGRVTSRTIQDGTTERSKYDPEGNRLSKTTFAGEELTFQYDAENRLKGQTVPGATGPNGAVPGAAATLDYTPSGQLVSQLETGPTTLNGTQSYKYDALDRLTELKNAIGQINYALDANGNLVERSIPGAGTVRTEYDAAGRIAKVTAPDGKTTTYAYDLAGRLVRAERELNPSNGQPQALVTHLRYDSADRVVALAEVKRLGGVESVVAGQALTRGPGGTIQRIDTYRAGSYDTAAGAFSAGPANTQAFEYDANARLTRETKTRDGATTDTAYAYDAAGNRTKKTVTTAAGVEITSYTYDAADRLTQEQVSLAAGGNRVTTYGWDGNGNLASKTEPGRATLYRFDPQNRLIDIRAGSTSAEAQAAVPSVSYAYDLQGNRVRKGGANPATYLIDSTYAYAQVALETKGSGSTAYVRGHGLIRQTRLNGAAAEDLFPLHGHLGTSLGAVDADGNEVERVEGDAFGNLGHSVDLKQAHAYTGEFWDQDAQLLYLRARWYDPMTGRFVSADPFAGKQRNPRTINRYSYVGSDPTHIIDPSGELGITSISPAAIVNVSLPAVSAKAGLTATTKFALEFAFEYATGIPVLVSPKNILPALKNMKTAMTHLDSKFWLDKFKGGKDFESVVQELWRGLKKNYDCFRGGVVADVRKNCFIPDFVTKAGGWVEVKSSMGAVDKNQFLEFVKVSANSDKPLTMLFLQKPTASDMQTLQRWATDAGVKTGDDIMLTIIHVLD